METDSGVEAGKLFVGGLSWDTKDEGFKSYFEDFGEVKETKIMQDSNGKPRGFGFVTFRDPASVQKVLSRKSHSLDNKKIDPKPATLKPITSQKVFIGGLPANCEDDDLRAVCSEFGAVTGVDIKGKGAEKNRGFGFVDFDNAESVDKICARHYIMVNDKRVEVKRAEPRKGGRTPQQQQQQQQHDMQQGFAQSSYGFPAMGRGMGGGATGHYIYNPFHYNAYASAGQPYAGQYGDYRGTYGGQQGPMSSYPDTTSGYSQARGTYGTGATDQYSGATSFSAYEQHLGYSYPTDQSGSMNYNGHAATPQQRSGYTTYGRS